jgi:hypothetical protein
VFLARAAARFELVEAGEMPLSEAYDDLVQSILPERPPAIQRRPVRPPQAPRVTLDALIYELRTHGLPQLGKANCRRRLGDLSTRQMRELIASLMRLRPKYSAITNELILKLGDYL